MELMLTVHKLALEVEAIKKDAQIYPDQVSQAKDVEKKARMALDTTKSKLELFEREHRDMTTTFELENERLKKSKTKLKQLKTPYEFQALNREIFNTEKSNAELEINITKKLEEIEAEKKKLVEVESQWKTAADSLSKIEGESGVKSAEFSGVLAAKQSELDRAKQGVDRALLSKYMFVQKRYSDALVPMQKSSCQGCFRTLPPQMVNEILRTKEIVSCPNCSRLLYVPSA